MNFDFSNSKSGRPSVARIMAAWKKAGRPARFTVEYGETFAEFEKHGPRWYDSGNGCRGVDRLAVIRALEKAPVAPEKYADELPERDFYEGDSTNS